MCLFFFRYFAARLNFNSFHSVLLNLPSYGSSLDNITCTNSNQSRISNLQPVLTAFLMQCSYLIPFYLLVAK